LDYMADDAAISQEDIDNLLASLSFGDEEESPAAAAAGTMTVQTWLDEWISKASAHLGKGISCAVAQVDCISSWDQWTYEDEPATMLVEQYGSADNHQTLLLLPTLSLQQLCINVLGEDPATVALPITEPQMTAMGGGLKAFVKQLDELRSQEYPAVTHTVTPFELTDYDKGFITDLAPWLTDGPFYEVTWTVTGLATGPVTVYQLWQQSEADRLLALANTPKPAADSKPHASPPKAETVTTVQASATVADAVTVQPVQFSSLDHHPSLSGEANKNLDLVLDISLNLSVELGKTQLSIKEVLELTRGSVIELDRIAGEPVDLYANGKMIAKGEVVVIEDSFGLRITSIASPADRLKGLA
jgi:flagellar motor switch protein FliN